MTGHGEPESAHTARCPVLHPPPNPAWFVPFVRTGKLRPILSPCRTRSRNQRSRRPMGCGTRLPTCRQWSMNASRCRAGRRAGRAPQPRGARLQVSAWPIQARTELPVPVGLVTFHHDFLLRFHGSCGGTLLDAGYTTDAGGAGPPPPAHAMDRGASLNVNEDRRKRRRRAATRHPGL